jgi:hypothetical protein
LPDGHGWTLIEVKSHQPDAWDKYGRSMNAHQVTKLESDLVTWCVVPAPLGTRAVIVGWSPGSEVKATNTPEIVLGHENVQVHARLRAPSELLAWLESGRTEAVGS